MERGPAGGGRGGGRLPTGGRGAARGLASSEGFGDHHLYRSFAERITSGELPYRDFFVEYPPGALPVFLAPAAAGSHYPFAFKLLMAICGAAAVALLALTLVRLGASGRRLWLAVAAAALVPTFFATVAVNTYDLWPALLVMAAVWALVAGRERLLLRDERRAFLQEGWQSGFLTETGVRKPAFAAFQRLG